MRAADHHVITAEKPEDHANNDLQAQQVQNSLRFTKRQLEAQPGIQRNKEDTAQQHRQCKKNNQKDEQPSGLQVHTLLHLTTVVVEGHLHVGICLDAVIDS